MTYYAKSRDGILLFIFTSGAQRNAFVRHYNRMAQKITQRERNSLVCDVNMMTCHHSAVGTYHAREILPAKIVSIPLEITNARNI